MAIPKSLKEISESKALNIIAKHLKVGTGENGKVHLGLVTLCMKVE